MVLGSLGILSPARQVRGLNMEGVVCLLPRPSVPSEAACCIYRLVTSLQLVLNRLFQGVVLLARDVLTMLAILQAVSPLKQNAAIAMFQRLTIDQTPFLRQVLLWMIL